MPQLSYSAGADAKSDFTGREQQIEYPSHVSSSWNLTPFRANSSTSLLTMIRLRGRVAYGNTPKAENLGAVPHPEQRPEYAATLPTQMMPNARLKSKNGLTANSKIQFTSSSMSCNTVPLLDRKSTRLNSS